MTSSDSSRRPLLFAVALCAPLFATLLLYLPGLAGELVYDDLNMVGRNPWIADLSNLPTIISSPYWDFLEPEESQQIGYWRPLTGACHAISFWVGNGAPWAFHALGLAVHLGAVLASFFLTRRLTGSVPVAGFCALIFGLHPVHVESVAWISALNDPLFGLFALLAMLAHLRWREGGSRGVAVLAPLMFALALASKELGAAVLPLILAVELGRTSRHDEGADTSLPFLYRPLAAYLPLLGVLVLYLAARMLVFESIWAGFDRQTTDFVVGAARIAGLRVEILGGSLELLAWPLDLRLFRPFRPTLAWTHPDLLRAMAWILVTAGATWGAWRAGRGALLTALLVIPAGLLPVLVRMESLGSFPLSDRFLYLPVFGFGLLLALLAFRFLPKPAAAIVLVVVGGLYAAKSHERIGTWANEEILFVTAAQDTPRSPYVQWGLGRVMLGKVEASRNHALLEKTFEVYENAALLLVEAKRPDTDLFVSSRDFLQVRLGLGWCYVLLGQIEEAEGFGTALALFEKLAEEIELIYQQTRQAEALGIRTRTENLELEQVYTAIGVTHLLAGHPEPARQALQRALSLNPDYPEAHQNLGRVYHAEGQFLVARRHFESALAQRPTNLEDRLLIADCWFQEGNVPEAERMARDLLLEYSDEPAPMVVLATAAMQRQDWSEALRWLDRALAEDPGHGHAWYLKATALLVRDGAAARDVTGAGRDVLEAFRKATALAPKSFEAHYQFAAYLLMTGAVDAAVPLLTTAYELCDDDRKLQLLRQNFAGLPEPTADLFCDLAAIDRRRGEFDLTESWLNAALTLDANHGPSLLLKARLLRRRDRRSEALHVMRLAVAALPASYEIRSELGASLAEEGLVEEAIEALEAALALETPAEWDEELAQSSRERLAEKIRELRAALETPGPRRVPPEGESGGD